MTRADVDSGTGTREGSSPVAEGRHQLDVRSVTKAFGSTVAIDGISFSVRPSEIVTIVGPSGCGKTTILDVLAGFERADSGSACVDGKEVNGPSPERSVVFQQPALFPWLTVRKNILFGCERRGGSISDRVNELINAVGLSGFERAYPYQLSGGMRQRVSIAQALLRQPAVLLMDEPFAALDAQTRLVMQELLQEVWTVSKPTVVFVTHDVEEAIFVGDRVIVLTKRPGRVKETLEVSFPRPRTFELLGDASLAAMKGHVLHLLRDEDPAMH